MKADDAVNNITGGETEKPASKVTGSSSSQMQYIHDPFEQTDNEALWKLNHPFAEVLAGAPK